MGDPVVQGLPKSAWVGETVPDGKTGLWKGVCSLGRVVEDSSEFGQRSRWFGL